LAGDEALKLLRRIGKKSMRYLTIQRIKIDRRIDHRFEIVSIVTAEKLDVSKLDELVIRYLTDQYLQHNFDLLGSGWVNVGYEAVGVGVEGYKYAMRLTYSLENVIAKAYIRRSKRFLPLITDGYQPIDWQKDFKSGYRWSAKTSSVSIRFGDTPGSDVIVPWELARMQHLPRLAVFAVSDHRLIKMIVDEFQNEVVDFYIHNPCEYGVNWTSRMDAAIRLTNILVAYDILRNLTGNGFSEKFHICLCSLVYEHTRFIIREPKGKGSETNNHYLSALAGLLISCAYLPISRRTAKWTLWAADEFKTELKKQFYSEGTNVEGATGYHCLSSELALFSTAAITYLRKHRSKEIASINALDEASVTKRLSFSEDELSVIAGMPKFISEITRPDNQIVLIGDYDSGRLFRLSPVGEMLTLSQAKGKYKNLSEVEGEGDSPYWDEHLLNFCPVLAEFSAIIKLPQSDAPSQFPLEASLIKCLIGNAEWTSKINTNIRPDTVPDFEESYASEKRVRLQKRYKQLHFSIYRQFGVAIYRDHDFLLCVYWGPERLYGAGVHAHNDRLSFELYENKRLLCADPGSYLYTPIPALRNKYRSTLAHNTIHVPNIEQNLMLDLFVLKNESRSGVIWVNENGIKLYCSYQGIRQTRELKLDGDSLYIKDTCNKPFESELECALPRSNGYGKLFRQADGSKSEPINEA
jgi:hypothetical protein